MGRGQSGERPGRGKQLSWGHLPAAAALLATMLSIGHAQARPVTMFVGAQHTPSVLYGPTDMLCDLNTCRLFNLPKEIGLPASTIVEFGLPTLNGQDRVDIRRCFQICRASVLGFETKERVTPGHGNPAITITPIELRLE